MRAGKLAELVSGWASGKKTQRADRIQPKVRVLYQNTGTVWDILRINSWQNSRQIAGNTVNLENNVIHKKMLAC